MTRAGDKTPFPMPNSGVISDQHPFAIGHGGLSMAQNWLLLDGIFRTRNGIFPVDPQRRWYEKLAISQNLVPDKLAEGSNDGLTMLTSTAGITLAAENSIVGDHQYVLGPGGAGTEVVTDGFPAEPGLPYTGWVFASENVGAMAMEFMDSSGNVLSSHPLSGDEIDQGVFSVTETSPQTTAAIRFSITRNESETVRFGPLKVVHGERIVAWSFGDGYPGAHDQNIFPMEVAHPETTQEAIAMWSPIQGKEGIYSYQGGEVLGIFDDYDHLPIAGRALAYTAQPSQILPSIDEVTGLELKEEFRVDVDRSKVHKMSVSYYLDAENGFIAEMKYRILAICYNESGDEIDIITLVSNDTVNTPPEDTFRLYGVQRGRAEKTFQPVFGTVKIGLRVQCTCPTGERKIVYDNNNNIVYDNAGNIVLIESGNYVALRLGIIIEDIKLVESLGSDDRWYDFALPVIEHSGVYGAGEYPLEYYPHDYLFEGATETNRIIMASNHSLWKWDDVEDEWIWVGFDLETVYSEFYLSGLDDNDNETLTFDARISFEQTDDEGYSADTAGGEPDELEIEVRLPSAPESGTNPEPAEYWQYRVNGGDWSDQYPLNSDPPIIETQIEIDFGTPRTLPIKIKLDATGQDTFEDICVRPEDVEPEDFPDPIFKAAIATRVSDDEDGETLFRADRDHPVDMRGYDFEQKTWAVCANSNDRIVAWDGQLGTKVERAGQGAPYAKTICVSGGRVLAGNVRFADPGDDLIPPFAVVYSDTFLGAGFRNWHPELAIRLADTPGEVVKLLELGNLAAACYKTDAIYMLVFQTGNNPFRPQLMASNVPGPIGVRSCIAINQNTHFFLARDGGIYTFDGSYPRNFSPNISGTIQSELDLNFKERAFLSFSPRFNSVLAMYPTKGSDGRVNRGMWIDMERGAGWPFEWDADWFDFTAGNPVQTIEHYNMGGITMRMGNILSALNQGQTTQPDFFLGAADGTTFVMDQEAGDDWGEKIKAMFRSGLTEFGLQDRFSLMKEIEFIVNRTNLPHTLAVELWGGDYGTSVKPIDYQTINLFEDGPYSVEVRQKFRYWGYGVAIDALEQIILNGAYASMRALGRRKS